MQISRTAFWLIGAMVVACGSDDERGDVLVSPSDPSALSEVITIPGAVRVQGQPPARTSSGPSIQSGESSLSVDSGGQAVLDISYQGQSGYTKCLVQVQGADDYFEVAVDDPIVQGQIQIPVNIPDSVDTGSFSLYTCVVDAAGGVSNPISAGVSVTRPYSNPPASNPGTGDDVCSGQQVSAECTLEFCASPDASNCYYLVNGARINCPGCSTSTCVQQAVNACLD